MNDIVNKTPANGAETRVHFYSSRGWLLRIDGDRFKEDLTYDAGGWGGPDYYDGRIKTTGFMYNWAGKPTDYAVQYTYDNLGQLTSADNNLNNAWDIGIGNTISYDPNGNILDLTRNSPTASQFQALLPQRNCLFFMPVFGCSAIFRNFTSKHAGAARAFYHPPFLRSPP
ncbi:hypothetical protein KJ068_30440 [bacterium]|nr:hypothetical protein [bacterium]RIK74491.1 MAG: hypothetical protein DCC62_15145 [candidate division KSB1 bacterium]